ncbi:ethanolamine ammonia-lyase subunit EutC [Anaerophilus nitritogenes]|uniref:ethanolamine ammonia-lyase subunit EutC n=1 Tax=Anaerophilus nitritogenes TaxID=2498136 RepID=UPI001930E788|nr:ethanolamine ammonia-lyase subunit EutC [Anaerophilus nitritogenes]
MSQKDIKSIIDQVINEMNENDEKDKKIQEPCSVEKSCTDENIKDITEIDLRKELLVPNAENKEVYLNLKETTPARVGIFRAGPRYKTQTLLRFRADHAVAQDAVFTDVAEDFIEDMRLFSITTMCHDKDEYLTRPDLGRKFDDENKKIIQEKCVKNPQVQIYISDGLSSTAIEANAKDALASIMQGLKEYNLKIGTPFFVKYGRVPAMDSISEIVDAEATVVLIGERPGLATGESMSCYMAYNAKVGMPESNRTVISNIHQGGTPAVEAGAHIAEIIKKMLDQKASGLNLKL